MADCDYIEACCTASLACLCLGIIFASLGLVIGVDHKIDMSLPARKMEEVEKFYTRLALVLQFCNIIAACFVATGALLLILAVTIMAVKGELTCHEPEADKNEDTRSRGPHDDENKPNLPLLPSAPPMGDSFHDYGSSQPANEMAKSKEDTN